MINRIEVWTALEKIKVLVGEMVREIGDNGGGRGAFRYIRDCLNRPGAFILDPVSLPLREGEFSIEHPGVFAVFEDRGELHFRTVRQQGWTELTGAGKWFSIGQFSPFVPRGGAMRGCKEMISESRTIGCEPGRGFFIFHITIISRMIAKLPSHQIPVCVRTVHFGGVKRRKSDEIYRSSFGFEWIGHWRMVHGK